MGKNTENNKNSNNNNILDKLVVDINNNLSTRLSDLMSKLLNSSQDKLFNMSDEADNNKDQTRYFELMNQIRTLKTSIAEDFNANISEYLLPAIEFERKHAKTTNYDELDELSLIERDDMEGIVLVKGIGERAGAKYREQLSHLEARFEHLALKTPKTIKKDALHPTNFCQAFNDALADNFDNTNKKLLFGMFDAEVANKLDALYDSINNKLIDADILPQIKLHIAGKKSASRPSSSQSSSVEANPDEQHYDEDSAGHAGGGHPGGGQTNQGNAGGAQSSASGSGNAQPGSPSGGGNVGGFAMTAAPGGNYKRAGQAGQNQTGGNAPQADGSSNVAGATQTGDGQGGNHSANAQGGSNADYTDSQESSSNNAEYQHYTAGMPASRVGRVLGNYIGGTPLTPNNAESSAENQGEFFPESTPQHFGHQEIIQALSNLQSLPQFEQPEEGRFDGDAIKQAVLAEIAKKSGGAVTKRINQIAEKTIDFIELIFDAIIDDDDISDTIKALLLRLQIPIIKASMSDQEFFIYDAHPARVLLDTIADVGVGITEHTDGMYKHLDKVVSNILGEYDLTTDTFQTALDSLNNYIEEQEAIVRAKEEEAQQQTLRKHARATVLKALRATTTGKTLPELVHPLILKRWPTLMFNHYLSEGKENNAWVNIVLTLRHIVESVQPIISVEHLAKIMAEKDALLEQTEAYLNTASNSKKDVKSIMDDYRSTLQAHIDDANYTEEEVIVAEEIVSQAGPEEEAPIEEEKIECQEIPANVMPGMWFQVYMGEDVTPRRCKLSVIIVEDANLMFVNQKGELLVEKSFDEFNEELASNKSKMIMGHSAFDHAFKSVIDRLH